jgi:signal transduction histidine kinase
VVFCGIKYLDENKLYGEANITGVIEQVDIERNVQLILQLQRGIRRIVVVTDNSPTSISTIRRFVPVLKQYRGQIDFHFTEAMHNEQLRRFLSRLSPDQAVILVRHTQDIEGRLFTMEESALAVTEHCPVPVYAFWDHYLGNGILGGLLVSGHAQGKIAAGIALEILQGKNIDEIPVQEGTAGLFMFDARLLKKHQIPEHRLPEDRIVIHQPLSFYNQYQRLILTVLAGIIGLSLIIVILSINIIRRRRVEKSLKKTSHRLALMREIDHAILNAFSIEFVAEKLMEPIQHIFDCDIIGLVLTENDDPQARLIVRYRLKDQVHHHEFDLTSPQGSLNEMKRGQFRQFSRPTGDISDWVRHWHHRYAGLQYLLTPLFCREQPLGFLLLGSNTQNLADRTLRANGLEVADSLAVAIQNSRLLKALQKHEAELRGMSAHIIEAQENERKYLSAELHDEFGQTLTAIGLNLSLIRNKLGPNCIGAIDERLEQTARAIETLYDQTHDLALKLRPTILDDLGLTPTLRWYLNQYQEQTGRTVEFSADEHPDCAIPDTVAVTFYRILQEALTNITKYAAATAVSARLITRPHRIELTVTDNGVGFDLEAVMAKSIPNRGLGLVGMRERLDLLDGTLKIETGIGCGTTLQATVPINGNRHD